MTPARAVEGVSFDLFGTLVTVERPRDPAAAVARELSARDVPVPADWAAAYAESHVEVPAGAELSLPTHVAAAVASREDVTREAVQPAAERAVLAAFDAEVRTRPGAARTVDRVADRRPVGVLSNCSVPGLVRRTLERSEVDTSALDAVVTSVGCGWRKPDERAFAAVADTLGVAVDGLLHVGDDPAADGGADEAGATSRVVESGPLPTATDLLGRAWA